MLWRPATSLLRRLRPRRTRSLRRWFVSRSCLRWVSWMPWSCLPSRITVSSSCTVGSTCDSSGSRSLTFRVSVSQFPIFFDKPSVAMVVLLFRVYVYVASHLSCGHSSPSREEGLARSSCTSQPPWRIGRSHQGTRRAGTSTGSDLYDLLAIWGVSFLCGSARLGGQLSRELARTVPILAKASLYVNRSA